MTHVCLSVVMSGVLLASVTHVAGCRSQSSESPRENAALARPDRSWIRLDGTVVSTAPESFELDFGDGVVTVEMDDWDRANEARPMRANDKVIVYGRIDQDLHRRKAVEAAGVYVESLGTTFFASAADEESVGLWPRTDIQLGRMEVNGRIAAISGKLVELDTGAGGKVTIDVSQLGYDPLDDEGFQQLDVGDRIRVIGQLRSAYFASNSLIAERIVSVQQPGQKAG
jgi:uncharacterized protein YdeI (BOF family)